MEPTTSSEGLSFIIKRFFELNRESDAPQQEAKKFAELLHTRLKANPQFGDDCRVDIFGSMRSGLWTSSSDVDICVRLGKDDVDIPKDAVGKFITAIKKIVRALKFAQAIPIMCRIPIVKFAKNWDGPGIHGDISFLNEIAIYNSDLLHAYSKWDDRVLILGLFVKKWASVCEVGSGQDGYPSSYAWIVMLVQFLQNTTPKVLPNIQQDFIEEDEDSVVDHIIKGYNTYFYKHVKPNWSQNEKTVGELFIGFLDYYAEYDFTKQAVQIHAKEPIMKAKINSFIIVVDPITDERIGCKTREKARFITEEMIPKSREAFAAHRIAAGKFSSLGDLDVVLNKFKKSHIGPTLAEVREARREKQRLDGLERRRVLAEKALAEKRAKESATASPVKPVKPAATKPSSLLNLDLDFPALPSAKCLHIEDALEAKPSTSSTVASTRRDAGLSYSEENDVKDINDLPAKSKKATTSNGSSLLNMELHSAVVPLAKIPSTSSSVGSSVIPVGLSPSEENNVKNVYDVLKILPGDSSNLSEHPETIEKPNGKIMSKMEEILRLRAHISGLQRHLAKLENDELKAGRPIFPPKESKPNPSPKGRSRGNKHGKQEELQHKKNVNSAAMSRRDGAKKSLPQNIANGSAKLTKGSKIVQIKESPNGALSAGQKE